MRAVPCRTSPYRQHAALISTFSLLTSRISMHLHLLYCHLTRTSVAIQTSRYAPCLTRRNREAWIATHAPANGHACATGADQHSTEAVTGGRGVGKRQRAEPSLVPPVMNVYSYYDYFMLRALRAYGSFCFNSLKAWAVVSSIALVRRSTFSSCAQVGHGFGPTRAT